MNTADNFGFFYEHLANVKISGKVEIPDYLMRFFEGGDKAKARETFLYLISQYPDSEFAKKAKGAV